MSNEVPVGVLQDRGRLPTADVLHSCSTTSPDGLEYLELVLLES